MSRATLQLEQQGITLSIVHPMLLSRRSSLRQPAPQSEGLVLSSRASVHLGLHAGCAAQCMEPHPSARAGHPGAWILHLQPCSEARCEPYIGKPDGEQLQ